MTAGTARNTLRDVPNHERQFYSLTRAIGRFGMRIFPPRVMEGPHWHGHVELNFLTGASMHYDVDGRELVIPPDRIVAFWAGIPHQLTRLTPTGEAPPRLANIYVPLDTFLSFTHIAEVQIALLSGGLVALAPYPEARAQIDRWYAEYRTGNVERVDIVKMELNALFRRARLDGLTYIQEPSETGGGQGHPNTEQSRHVVAMLRYILENLDRTMTNADIASVTGLHENYAQTLFSNTMRMPTKQFVIRMRLLRARAILLESNVPVARVADMTGFSSTTQFYHHFRSKYGLTPSELRARSRYG